jgi:Mor family transcriptional regulator
MIKSEQNKRDKKILRAYFEGEKVRNLASRYGLYPQRIYQIIDEWNKKQREILDK